MNNHKDLIIVEERWWEKDGIVYRSIKEGNGEWRTEVTPFKELPFYKMKKGE